MFDIQAQGSFFLRSLNFSTVTSTNVSAIFILGACLVLLLPQLHSNDAGVPGLLFRAL